MTAFRRLEWNFALQHAVGLARSLSKPLVLLEVLKVDYPYAGPRFHRFILEGMADRAGALRGKGVLHYPFVEREPGEGEGLVQTLAARACCVVVDDCPSFILPAMTRAVGDVLDTRLELVDSNGLLPLRDPDRVFTAAYHFRRFLQRRLPEHLGALPEPAPLDGGLPGAVPDLGPGTLGRWPRAPLTSTGAVEAILRGVVQDGTVPSTGMAGGTQAARARLAVFLERGLDRYEEDRNHPDRQATSGLSPHLHFGDLSSHEVFSRVADREEWTPVRLSGKSDGSRSGWWGMTAGAEAFLDQLITWRELGFNMSSRNPDHMRFESLPDWARKTLQDHQDDPRPYLYAHEELRDAETHDPLWNAAQRQLREEGVIHNYLRMLWGKKILEWTPSPRDALAVMIDLNDRFALDGRDPNSYSGIFWCLGRYDRGWQERPVFGKIRYMSSERTRKKVDVEDYLRRFGAGGRSRRED